MQLSGELLTPAKLAGLLQFHFFATFRQKIYLTDYQCFRNFYCVNKPLIIYFQKYFSFHYTSLHF